MANKKSQKIPKKFVCINCDYNTCNSKDYYKHCSTQKHKRLITTNEKSQKSPKNNETLTCSCGKTYKHLSSLYKHKKSCSNENMNEKYQDKIDKLTNIVLDIVNKNTELTQKIVELSSKPIINNIYNDKYRRPIIRHYSTCELLSEDGHRSTSLLKTHPENYCHYSEYYNSNHSISGLSRVSSNS